MACVTFMPTPLKGNRCDDVCMLHIIEKIRKAGFDT